MKSTTRKERRSRPPKGNWLNPFTFELTWADIMHDLDPTWGREDPSSDHDEGRNT